MNTVVAFRFHWPGLVVVVSALLILSTGRVQAQRQGSRPIEFSEPRDKDANATNDQRFGSERRRLTDLEERLSKTFDFFDTDDSMSGVPAPRLPRRAPVVAKQSKPTGLFEDRDEESAADALSRLRELLDSERLTSDTPFESANQQASGGEKVNLLNSLKTDDWLVKGTMSDSFWEVPIVIDRHTSEPSNARTPQSRERESFDLHSKDNQRPRFEVFSGGDGFRQSPFGRRTADDRTFTGGNAFQLGRPSRALDAEDARREEYRALLGMEPKPGMGQPPTVAGVSRLGRFPEAPAKFTSQVSDLRTAARESLYPVRSPDRSSLYPAVPTAPQRPNVLDPIGDEVPVTSRPSSADLLSSPFYEPPRRQF